MASKSPPAPSRAAKGKGSRAQARVADAGLPGPDTDPAMRVSERHELPFPVVGVGASAGGLDAFSKLLHGLPPDIGMAFVLIQHLDPTHASMLTDILQRSSKLTVQEAANDMAVEPNRVYVIPPASDMIIQRGELKLSPRKDARSGPRSVDHFLRSL